MEATTAAAALAAKITANGYATLTGITAAKGQCDACGRELGRIFQVRHADGSEGFLGRRCAGKATGYAATKVERAALAAARLAERDCRRQLRRAELANAGHGEILAWLETQPTAVPGGGYASDAFCLLGDILDGCDGLLTNAYALRA